MSHHLAFDLPHARIMKRVATLVAVGLALCGVAFAAARGVVHHDPVHGVVVQTGAAAAPRAYSTEQEWLISEIAGAIWNMSAFANGPGPSRTVTRVTEVREVTAPVLAEFAIASGAESYDVKVTTYLWAPEAFVPLVTTVGDRSNRDPKAAAEDGDLILALTNPLPQTIQAENIRVSHLLKASPRDASLHHQAALLVGALALRDNAATMSDPRQMMCRMTAHLAFARAVEPSRQTTAGRLAEAVLLVLANRQRHALDQLDAIQNDETSTAVRAWTRALRVRATRDWRLDLSSATLLEAREALRAAHVAANDPRSLPMLDMLEERANITDWSRVIFHQSPSVEAGNRFAGSSVAAELVEAAVIRATFPNPPDVRNRDAFIRELNLEPSVGPAIPGDAPQFWILDWGTWAAASQRHIAAALVCTSHHLFDMLSSKDRGRETDARSREYLGGLRLFPLVAPYLAKHAEDRTAYASAIAAAAAFARSRPELVTDGLLTDLHEQPAFADRPQGVPANAEWFRPYFPVGTAFDAHRVYTVKFAVRFEAPELERLKAIAPYEPAFLLRWIDKKFGDHPPLDVVQQECRRLGAYDRNVAWKVARVALDQPDVYVPVVSRIAAEIDPDDWYWVAEYLADYGRVEEAREAFERYVDSARDQVGVSSRVWWLVLYYYEHGRKTDAMTLAKRAADVYSGNGLATYGDLLDLSGDTRGAEKTYRALWERYDIRDGEWLGFLLRHKADSRAYATEAEQMTARIFPDGIQAASMATSTGAPDLGVRIKRAGHRGEQAGLRNNDIIVAIDGIRVRNKRQYAAMKYQSWAPAMRFLVWRAGHYVEVSTELRHRWVASQIANYTAGAPGE
jgi:tetratricopeptide (TPR) repeat protein